MNDGNNGFCQLMFRHSSLYFVEKVHYWVWKRTIQLMYRRSFCYWIEFERNNDWKSINNQSFQILRDFFSIKIFILVKKFSRMYSLVKFSNVVHKCSWFIFVFLDRCCLFFRLTCRIHTSIKFASKKISNMPK